MGRFSHLGSGSAIAAKCLSSLMLAMVESKTSFHQAQVDGGGTARFGRAQPALDARCDIAPGERSRGSMGCSGRGLALRIYCQLDELAMRRSWAFGVSLEFSIKIY